MRLLLLRYPLVPLLRLLLLPLLPLLLLVAAATLGQCKRCLTTPATKHTCLRRFASISSTIMSTVTSGVIYVS